LEAPPKVCSGVGKGSRSNLYKSKVVGQVLPVFQNFNFKRAAYNKGFLRRWFFAKDFKIIY
jgi:hypothetical protein